MDDEMVSMFGFLAGPLGWVMRLVYGLVQDYGITIILFTVLVRILMFPLTMKQQKSQARMSAFQPMIQEIQKKWANDRQKQNEEVMKFQEENNLKMTAGCLPMVVNMIVLFGIIAVIQAPMQYMLNISNSEVRYGAAIAQVKANRENFAQGNYTMESELIGYFSTNPEWFVEPTEVDASLVTGTEAVQEITAEDGSIPEGATVTVQVSPETIESVNNFNFRFIGLNLANKPEWTDWVSLIFPILSILTMFASQIIIMKTSGQTQGKGQMWIMTLAMGAFFGWFAFTIPQGFSLYYTVSNVVMTVQQLIVKRIYDPEKIKEEIMLEIEERKKAKKAKKRIVIKDESGQVVTKELSESELARIRLEKARQMDAEKYADTQEEEKAARAAAEKAREIDEEKYGGKSSEKSEETKESSESPDESDAETDAQEELAVRDEAEEAPETERADKVERTEYKPGRRKRSRKNKENSSLPKDMQDSPKEDE